MKLYKKILVGFISLFLISCNNSIPNNSLSVSSSIMTNKLEAPTGLYIENENLCWNPVDYCINYTVSIDGKEKLSNTNYLKLGKLQDGTHCFKVKANGDGKNYFSSEYSAVLEEKFIDGSHSVLKKYKYYDESTKVDSLIGYGFDVVTSSSFCTRVVKTSFPIFDIDKLGEINLLKVEDKDRTIKEIESDSLKEYMNDWNAGANVDVNFGGNLIGGSVEVGARFSGGKTEYSNRYYHTISIVNQRSYLILQSNMSTYRSIISEELKNDLYSKEMTPAKLFKKYGTHFITSAILGGKINTSYLYCADENTSYLDVVAKVKTNVRYFTGSTDVSVEGGYQEYAASKNVFVNNSIEMMGGSDYGILSDLDIPYIYEDWEKSLDEKPSIIGIKDTGSLVPIWDLIDPSLDPNHDRLTELESYFIEYGKENYNSLLKKAGLPEFVPPTEIIDVKVDNKSADESTDEFKARAGDETEISFSVEPYNAVDYTKTAKIISTSAASISYENGSILLKIEPDVVDGEIIKVCLSAGDVDKIINIRVVNEFTVNFNTNGGSNIKAINAKYGKKIYRPNDPVKEGYVFSGWYTKDNGWEEENPNQYIFDFEKEIITKNITLYAHWIESSEVSKPEKQQKYITINSTGELNDATNTISEAGFNKENGVLTLFPYDNYGRIITDFIISSDFILDENHPELAHKYYNLCFKLSNDFEWKNDIKITLRSLSFKAPKGMDAFDTSVATNINVTFNFVDNVEIFGGDGLDGANGTNSSNIGSNGNNGADAILGNNLIFEQEDSSKVIISGGHGGKGGIGYTYTNTAYSNSPIHNGGQGGKGGNGGRAINSTKLLVNSYNDFTFIAGDGGNGGNGGNGQHSDRQGTPLAGSGGKGGNGGNSGTTLYCAASIEVKNNNPQKNMKLISGKGGNGGNGGIGGDGVAANNYDNAGNGGNGGDGGSCNYVLYTFNTNYKFNIEINNPGSGGNGGNGGRAFWNDKRQGDGGHGGNGGNIVISNLDIRNFNFDKIFNAGDGGKGGHGGNGNETNTIETTRGGNGGNGGNIICGDTILAEGSIGKIGTASKNSNDTYGGNGGKGATYSLTESI